MPEKNPQGYKFSPPQHLHEIPHGLREATGPIVSARDTANGSASETSSSGSDSYSDADFPNSEGDHPPLFVSPKSTAKKGKKAGSKGARKARNIRTSEAMSPLSFSNTSDASFTDTPIVVEWGPDTVIPSALDPQSTDKASTSETDIGVFTHAGSIAHQSSIAVVDDEWETRETCTTWIRFRTWVAFPKYHGLRSDEIRDLHRAAQSSKRQTPRSGKSKGVLSKKTEKKKQNEEGKPARDIKTPTEDNIDCEMSFTPQISKLVTLAHMSTLTAERFKELLTGLRGANAEVLALPWNERNGRVAVTGAEGGHNFNEDADIAEGEEQKSMAAEALLCQLQLEIVKLAEGLEQKKKSRRKRQNGKKNAGESADDADDEDSENSGSDFTAYSDSDSSSSTSSASSSDDDSESNPENDDSDSDGQRSSEDSDASTTSSSTISSSSYSPSSSSSSSATKAKKRARDVKIEALEWLLKGMQAQLKILKGGW